MLWKFITTDEPNPAKPELVETQTPPKALRAFDAWLEAYRARLEQACETATSRPVGAAKTAGRA